MANSVVDFCAFTSAVEAFKAVIKDPRGDDHEHRPMLQAKRDEAASVVGERFFACVGVRPYHVGWDFVGKKFKSGKASVLVHVNGCDEKERFDRVFEFGETHAVEFSGGGGHMTLKF